MHTGISVGCYRYIFALSSYELEVCICKLELPIGLSLIKIVGGAKMPFRVPRKAGKTGM